MPEKLNILVAEYTQDPSSRVYEWLSSTGLAELQHASTGDATSRWLQNRRWDLVVAVIQSARSEGIDALKLARAANRWTSLLMIVPDVDPELAQRLVQLKADALLFEPVERAEFLAAAINLAQAARSRRSRESKRVLAVGAHPDDVEIGCGGTLAKHRDRGDDLMILTLSHGAVGGDVEDRLGEGRRAAAMLDARLEIADLPDTNIPEDVRTIEIIQKAILDFRPTHVYTHTYEDAHQDHRNVHRATIVAAREVANLYCYQSPSSTVDFSPNLFVDISNFIDRKLELIAVYESQTTRRDNLQSDLIAATARYWGRYAGYILAEPMHVIRHRED